MRIFLFQPPIAHTRNVDAEKGRACIQSSNTKSNFMAMVQPFAPILSHGYMVLLTLLKCPAHDLKY